MQKKDVSIYSLVLILFLCFASSLQAKENYSFTSYGGWSWEWSKPRELRDPIASLYLHLMTRPDVTADSDVKLLVPVAREAAVSFRQSISQGGCRFVKWDRFSKDVERLLKTFREEYALAAPGIEGAEDRGTAYYVLLDCFLQAAGQAGIPLQKLDLALLRGAARAESKIEEKPLSSKLSMEDRELIRLFLLATVSQLHHRFSMDETRDAFERMGAGDEITAKYDDHIYNVFKTHLKPVFIGLEKFLSDPQAISDANNLNLIQINNEAVSDLFMFKYVFELSSLSYGLDPLIAEFASRIPGMTVELLAELGILSVSRPITDIAAYYLVSPDMLLSYIPINGLADRLVELGGTPPATSDFSSFSDPYQALFRLHYDIKLCGLIASREWLDVSNAAVDEHRVPSLNERLSLKKTSIMRLSKVLAHVGGIENDTAKALVTLLNSSFSMRL